MVKRCAFLLTGLALASSAVGCCCLGGYGSGYGYRGYGCPPCGAQYAPSSPCGPGGCSPSYYPPAGQGAFYQSGATQSAFVDGGAIMTASPTMNGAYYPATATLNPLPTY